MTHVRMRTLAAVAATLLLLSGCANDPLAGRHGDGVSGVSDGSFVEFAPDARGDAVSFEGVTEIGTTLSSDDFAGDVVVVNFWYAECPPCRAEAGDLQQLSEKYADQGASFVGVNVYDQPAAAQAFARTFGVTYPSLMDAADGTVRLAFAGQAAPSATPTTLVLDREGRVAARFLGQISSASNLDTVIRELIAEEN